MQIIGFHFDKILAERKSYEFKENLKVNSNLHIGDVGEEKTPLLNQLVVKFVFEFRTEYEPEYAVLVFKGVILAAVEKKEGEEILGAWKQRKLEPKVQLPLFNHILSKCNLKSLVLEDELGLPPHIQLPKIAPEEKKASYTG